MAKRIIAASIFLLVGVGIAFWYGSSTPSPETAEMHEVARSYLQALYAQDYERAYDHLSSRDRRIKSQSVYLRENPPFPKAARELATELAALMNIGTVAAQISGDRATVTFPVRIPDANSPDLQELFKQFDPDRLAELSIGERKKIIDTARIMAQEGRLPMVAGTETLDLIKEDDGWKVFVNWSDAVKVVFRAEVKAGLPWAFEPVQAMIMAKPGETIHAAYRATNLSDRRVSGKARHTDAPKELAEKYLDVVQCFCFIRQTLDPGEQKELPLVFRVDLDVPRDVKEFVVTYQFFPLDKFPKEDDDLQL